MTEYLSIAEGCSVERIVEKSRFIAYVEHVESEEGAKAFLSKIRAMHPLATHVCYGFVADKTGNSIRFSDDGEPQGTAGMPILNVIRTKGLFETAIAVVRYFGGIKLGAGGLTRAYSSAAAEGVGQAKVRLFCLSAEIAISVDYADFDSLTRFLNAEGISPTSREFGEKPRLTVAVKKAEKQAFISRLGDCLCGRVSVFEIGERYEAFD